MTYVTTRWPVRTELERFLSHVAAEPDANGCLLWTGATSKGYGRFRVRRDGRWGQVQAHVYAWEQVHGPMPAGLQACHHCDVRPCCNVEHLFAGDCAANLADMRAKGRDSPPPRLFGNTSAAKLTAEDAAAIRRAYAAGGTPQRVLAERYGVTQTNISHIVLGKSWVDHGVGPGATGAGAGGAGGAGGMGSIAGIC